MDDTRIRPTGPPDPLTRIGGPARGLSTRQAPAESQKDVQAASESSTARLTQFTEAWVSELPLEILKDPEATVAEWAWRRELSAAATKQESAFLQSGLSTVDGKDEMLVGVRNLWTVLTELSGPDVTNRWQAEIPNPIADAGTGFGGSVLGFASMNRLPETWPDSLKKLVLRDRLLSSVDDGGRSHTGEGLFVVPPNADSIAMQLQPLVRLADEERVRVVRWRGERHSMPLEDGRQVHRLRLEIRVDGQPVEITVLSCHPSLSVHVATDHKALRDYCASAEGIQQAIHSLGWQLERWSVSELVSGGEI